MTHTNAGSEAFGTGVEFIRGGATMHTKNHQSQHIIDALRDNAIYGLMGAVVEAHATHVAYAPDPFENSMGAQLRAVNANHSHEATQ